MEYWLLYKDNKEDSANKRKIKPFTTYDAAENWGIKKDKFILGIANKYRYDKNTILKELSSAEDVIEELKRFEITNNKGNELMKRINKIKEIMKGL